MVSTSGARLLPDEDIKTLRKRLLPLATVLTPNMPEAKLLLKVDGSSESGSDYEVNSVEDLEEMARRVRALGPEWVLLKGGHIPFTSNLTVADGTTAADDKIVVDILSGPKSIFRIESRFQDSTSTHGTGCTLACRFGHRPAMSVADVMLTNLSKSGHRIQPLQGDGRPNRCQGRMPVYPTRNLHGTGVRKGSWPAEPLSLHEPAALLPVSLPPHFDPVQPK